MNFSKLREAWHWSLLVLPPPARKRSNKQTTKQVLQFFFWAACCLFKFDTLQYSMLVYQDNYNFFRIATQIRPKKFRLPISSLLPGPSLHRLILIRKVGISHIVFIALYESHCLFAITAIRQSPSKLPECVFKTINTVWNRLEKAKSPIKFLWFPTIRRHPSPHHEVN